MSPTRMEVRLLGPLAVARDGQPVDLPPSRKARALLAYLIATGRAHARSALCDLFWPDSDDPRAGLRWGLSKIRGIVDDEHARRVRTSGDQVAIDCSGALVDLHRVRDAVRDDVPATPTGKLREAADRFTGDFLEGLNLSGCHEFDAWCLGMRESLRTLRLSIHDQLVARLRVDPGEAVPYALARVSLDPTDEEACIAAMDLMGALGRARRAHEIYELCASVRSEYLGVSPSEALEAARLRLSAYPPAAAGRKGDGSGAADPRQSPPSPGPPDHLPPVADDEPALVGRIGERKALAERAARTASDGAGPVVLISGAPGIGKTRLLRELAQEVREAGGWVAAGRAVETEEVRPYGPWRDILHALPETAVDAGPRRDLAGLLPGADDHADRPADRGQLFDAVVRALLSRAGERAPGLLVLDDVHWLDEASAALLHYVTRTIGDAPILVVCSAREEEMAPERTATRVIRSLRAADRLHPIRLDPLDAEETTALVAAVHPAPDGSGIFSQSEGNPLFALELARARREGGSGVPATIEQELDGRLQRLGAEALDLLTWAAALGRSFDVSVLTEVIERSDASVVSAIGELERKGIVRASGDDRYDFAHALLHAAAYRRLSVPARRAAHRRIARVLAAGGPGIDRVPGAIAHHAELGGLAEMATRACVEAAERSVWVFAFVEAAELVERGLRQSGELSEATRIPLQMDLLHVYSRQSMASVRPPDLEERVRGVILEARTAGLTPVEADGYFHLAALQYQRGDYEETHRSSVRSAEAGRRGASDLNTARLLADAAICLLLVERDLERARQLTSEAEDLAAGRVAQVVQIPLARALIHHHDGELARAAEAFDEVVRLGRRVRDRWWESPARARRVMVDLDRDDPAVAAERAGEAERLAEQLGDEAEAAFVRGLAAVAAAMTSDGGPDSGELGAVDDALAELRTLDSLWKLAQVQAYAAEIDLRRGRVVEARARAGEILDAGEALDRPGLVALARGVRAQSALLVGDAKGAAVELAEAEAAAGRRPLSHRARGAVGRARAAVEDGSTLNATVTE